MSLADLSERIARSLTLSADLMAKLHDGLVERRTSWISARPSSVDEPVRALEQLAGQITDEQHQRDSLLTEVESLLPNPTRVPTDRRHVVVSVLCRHLPRAAAQRLSQASEKAAAIARRVRTEQTLGSRLLRFSQRAHDGLMQNVVQSIDKTSRDVGGYDMQAQRVHGALVGNAPTTGTLIDGQM